MAIYLLSAAIIIHGLLNWWSLVDNQNRHFKTQKLLQELHHKHEVEFAKQQAEMFRANASRQSARVQ